MSVTTCRCAAVAHYFYLHNDGTQNQSALLVSDSIDSPGRMLYDPNTERADATVALSEFTPSEQGDMVAYAISDGGTDWQLWRFRRVKDGVDLADTLRDTKFWGVSWAHDGSGVYYSRYPSLASGQGDDTARPALYFHKLGTAQHDDRLVYEVTNHPTRIPWGRVTEDGHYLVITLVDGYEKNGVELIDLRQPDGGARPLFPEWDGLYTFIGSHGEELYFRTTKDAPFGRVIAVDAHAARAGAVRTLIPQAQATLQEATYVGGRFIAKYVENAHSVVRVYERDGRIVGEVPLPGMGSVDGFEGEGRQTETFFGYTDYLTPRRIYRFDVPANQAAVWREPHIPASTSAYVTEQVFYASKDGTRIPMYITHRRDMVRDGNQPLLLYGYGGFDVSLTPQYRPQVQAWLEMGGAYAEANLRGGGEYGEAWHKAGTLANKQHVFDDFIAAAEYLIARALHAHRALGDSRPQQRRTADRGGADAAPGAVRCGAPGRRRPRHAALPDRERQRAAVVVRLRARRGSRAVQGAVRLLAGAERQEGHVLPADPHHHRRSRRSGRALAQLQIRRGAAGGAVLPESHPDPHRDPRRPRRRQAGVDADRRLRRPVGIPRQVARHDAARTDAGTGGAGTSAGSRGATLISRAGSEP